MTPNGLILGLTVQAELLSTSAPAMSLPNAAVSSRGERTRANGLLHCEVGLTQGVFDSIRPPSSCGCPRCHEKSKLDTEDGHLAVPHELVQALNVTAAPSARQALATDCEL